MENFTNLINQFNNMDRLPIIEIELNNGDYEMYTINCDNKSLWTRGVKNLLIVEFEEYFDNIDYYLEALYDLIIEDLINNGYEI